MNSHGFVVAPCQSTVVTLCMCYDFMHVLWIGGDHEDIKTRYLEATRW